MNVKETIAGLWELSDEEKLYQEYYLAKREKRTLNAFLKAQDAKRMMEDHIMIPELWGKDFPKAIEARESFDKSYYHRVLIEKYPCFMPPYEHENNAFEIIYVLKGNCLHNTSHHTQTLKEGDLCLVSQGLMHSLTVNNAESIVLDLRISVSTMSDLFPLMLRSENAVSLFFFQSLHSAEHQNYLLFHTAGDTELRNRMLEMYLDSRIADQYTKHLLNNMLNIMLIKLVRKHPVANQTASPQTDEQFRVIFYLTNHFIDTTLEDTARALNLSPAYCSRYIKAVTGYTYSQLINRMRFQYVATRLLTTNDSVTAISEALGYENPENFIRAFKKYYHMTPTQYRRQARPSSAE